MKVISFSLYGSSPTYTVGALKNICMYRDVLPDYRCHFYIGKSTPAVYRKAILHEGGTYTEMDGREDWSATMWRFEMLRETNVSHILFRDCDSRPGPREVAAVREWEASGKAFHVMRDHSAHMAAVMAGMWGSTQEGARRLASILGPLNRLPRSSSYDDHVDQHWLAVRAWPIMSQDVLQHASFWTKYFGPTVPFISAPDDTNFVGRALDHHDNDRYPPPWPLAESCKFCSCSIRCERR